MLDWRWPIRKLRKVARKRTPVRSAVPLGSGQVAGSLSHLQALLAAGPAYAPREGQIFVAEAASAAVAVEGCMAIPTGGVAVRGWLTDPHSDIVGVWLEIDGTFRPASFAVRMYRHDVLEQRGLLETVPGYRAGYYCFETFDVKPGTVAVNLHAITQTSHGFILLSSGTQVKSGRGCSLERLANEFEAGFATPPTIAGAAEPFLKGLAGATGTVTWREKRIEATSGEPADLAVVLVVNENTDMLHYLLAALEVCKHARKMEVVLALQHPGIELDVNRCVRKWRGASPFAAIKTLVPIAPIGFGLAASGAIAFSQGPVIAVASDEILPPNGNWVGAALELLSTDPQSVLIAPIVTFDHRPFTFTGAFELAWSEFEHDHSGVRALAGVESVRKALAWGCGFLVAGRDVLESSGLDDSLPYMDMCLLEFVFRMQSEGPAQLTSFPRQFTHLRLPSYQADHPAQRLWSLYALAGSIGRQASKAAQPVPPSTSNAPARPARQRQGATVDPA